MTQSYFRGDICRITFGHPCYTNGEMIDVHPEQVGREVMIVGSYQDQFGIENDRESYTILDMETGGQSSWKEAWQLELVKKYEGGDPVHNLLAKFKDKQ